MADRPKEGYSDGSDDGGNKTLRGFVLIRKNHGEKNSNVFAEHSRFNHSDMYYIYMYMYRRMLCSFLTVGTNLHKQFYIKQVDAEKHFIRSFSNICFSRKNNACSRGLSKAQARNYQNSKKTNKIAITRTDNQ